MSREERMPHVLVAPETLAGHAAGMKHMARSAYFMLWMNLWPLDEPGVVRAEPRRLAALACMALEDWLLFAAEVAKGFDTRTRPGYWIATEMVQAHRYQKAIRDRRRTAGLSGATARWSLGDNEIHGPANAVALATPGKRSRSKDLDSDSVPDLLGGSSKSLVRSRGRARDPYSEHPDFAEFYRVYPKPTKRRVASRAFNAALQRHADWTGADLVEMAISYGIETKNTDPQYIQHPSTWLNADAFLDQEDKSAARK